MRKVVFRTMRLILLVVCLVLVTGVAKTSRAANSVVWNEVDPPATTGAFVSQACGDIDEDGHLDLAGGTVGSGIWVTAGDGDGTWTPLGAVTTSGTYYGLALGDVDNDGKLDVVGAEEGSGVHIWTGDGSGGWTTMSSPVGTGNFRSIALGDVDNDGKLDIAAGSGDGNGIKVWTGDGAGGWTSATSDPSGVGTYPDLALGDLDRDGTPDLVAASTGAGVRVWRGGSVWTESSTDLPTSGDYYGVAVGDLDHDGDLDLVAAGDDTGVRAWSLSAYLGWSWTDLSTLAAGGQYRDIGLGDVDNNGDLDIAATAFGNGIQVWAGDGGGEWTAQSAGLPTAGIFHRLSLGDWDGDGILDLAAGHDAGARAWVDDGVPETLGGWVQIPSPTTTGTYQGLDVGDWNRDGKLDVVATGEESGIQLWEGDGGQTWADVSAWTGPDLPAIGTYAGVAFGDIDHNGWLDVVAGSGEEAGLSAWLFVNEVAWLEASGELPPTGTYLDVALGDFDNDGYLDIAAVGKELGVRAWQAQSFTPGSPGSWNRHDAGMPDSGTYASVAYGDLNDDGKLDIVAGSENAGLGVWQGDGTGNWTAQASPTGSAGWPGVAVGDVNHDGKLDIVAASDSLGVRAWAGDGAFGWTALAAAASSGYYTHLSLGDVNNDGRLDIAAGRGTDAGVAVWIGDGGTSWTPFSLNLPTSGTYPDVALGEIDNDGVLDLVGARYGGGSVHAWTGAEGTAPGAWANFSPTTWISTTRTVDVSVQVLDTGSGLDPNSAEFSILDGPAGWSAWQHADCTGTEETTDPETISAAGVTFSQDSGPWPYDRNQVKFRIKDMAGNRGYSDPYIVRIDTTPPTDPTTFTSSHYPGGGWESDNTVDVQWEGATDETSGVYRYSYVFNTFCDLPDTTADIDASDRRVTSPELADGEWNIAVRTRDVAGVWSPYAACDGPYHIDTQPPTNPTSFTATHAINIWYNDPDVTVNWTGAEDAGSGVRGYAVNWSDFAGGVPLLTLATTEPTTARRLDEGGSWYLNVSTVDFADNWALDVAHWGPFRIDFTPPYYCWINSPAESAFSSFLVEWGCNDNLSGPDHYDVDVSDDGGVTWGPWQPDTANTSATFSGAQNNTTYAFRVRARDRAGNQSDYLAQDQTSVRLPPGLDSVTPTSGFASAGQDSPPLQIVPGTEVVITGNALTGGVAYFDGVPMEPTRSQVVSDGEIRAVIGVGTPTGSATVCVRTPNGEGCSPDSFTVNDPPFPVRWGLGFDNFTTSRANMTWSVFEDAFGRCEVNFCPINIALPFVPLCSLCSRLLVPRIEAAIFYEASRGIADKGDCYGISSLTLDFVHGGQNPDDFARSADYAASLSWSTPGLARAIRARQWRQLSTESLSTAGAMVLLFETAGPESMKSLIDAELALGQPPMICIEDDDDGVRGHCVVPYATDPHRIWIYDNNFPYINNNFPVAPAAGCSQHDYLHAAMERFVWVDGAEWEYAGGACEPPAWDGNWMGAYFIHIPNPIVNGRHTLPTDLLGWNLFFGSNGAGYATVEDAEGRIIGYDAAGQVTQTIPISDAVRIVPYTDGPAPFDSYYFTAPEDITVHMMGTATGAYSMTLFGEAGTAFSLDDVALHAATQDALAYQHGGGPARLATVTADPGTFTLTTQDTAKALAAKLVRPVGANGEKRAFSLGNLAIASGTPLTLATGDGVNALVVGGGAGSTYDVCFYRQPAGDVPGEFCWTGLALEAGDRHILTPEAWDALSTTRVQLEVDVGGDGTVDATQWLVGHGLELAMTGTPATVHAGDRITYTLAYAVTGVEVAPGAVLIANVPLSTTLVSASGGVAPVDGVLTWKLGDLEPRAGGQVAFTVQVAPIPDDAMVAALATLRDASGRWAMASAASLGPGLTANTLYLAVVLKKQQ